MMKTFTKPLHGLKEFEDAEAAIGKKHAGKGTMLQISGCIDSAKPHMIYSVDNGAKNRIIVPL